MLNIAQNASRVQPDVSLKMTLDKLSSVAGGNPENIPTIIELAPDDLVVEAEGVDLDQVREIVANWDWTKFGTPVVRKTGNTFKVTDGVKRVLAAIAHPQIGMIPVSVITACAIMSTGLRVHMTEYFWAFML